MGEIEIIAVSDSNTIKIVASLAREIWAEYFTAIIGKAQVDYMLEKFQSEEAIRRQIAKEEFLYYLLERSGKEYIGYTAVVPNRDRGELFLSKLYVKSGERKKGYGEKVIRFIEGMARQMNLGKITLTVNKNNKGTIEAYLRMGFKNAGAVVTDIGGGFVMDDYRMEKTVRL